MEENDERETTATEDILTGSHMCVLDCGEEVEVEEDNNYNLAFHYADHYFLEGMRASLFN